MSLEVKLHPTERRIVVKAGFTGCVTARGLIILVRTGREDLIGVFKGKIEQVNNRERYFGQMNLLLSYPYQESVCKEKKK